MCGESSETGLRDDEGGKGIYIQVERATPDKVANGSLRTVDGAACRLCGFVQRVMRESSSLTSSPKK